MGSLLASQHSVTRANIALLSEADNADYSSIDDKFQPESLQNCESCHRGESPWQSSRAKRACVINAQMYHYQQFVLQGLQEDGYQIIDAKKIPEAESQQIVEEVKAVSHELRLEECKAIASAEDISESQLKKLLPKKAKTKIERHQERKALLRERYGVEVTPILVWKDDEGWYPNLRLHYFLTLGREQLPERDAATAKMQIEFSPASIWKPDFNRAQLLAMVMMLEDINIGYFLTPGVMFRGSDAPLQKLKEVTIKNRYIIKNYLGVSVSEGMSPMSIVQTLLGKLGLNLSYVARLGSRGKRERVYQFIEPQDGRGEVFTKWLNRCGVNVQGE